MLIRPEMGWQHNGSMNRVAEVKPTRRAIVTFLNAGDERGDGGKVTLKDLKVSRKGLDKRNGWDSHVVTVRGFVVAHTNGMPK